MIILVQEGGGIYFIANACQQDSLDADFQTIVAFVSGAGGTSALAPPTPERVWEPNTYATCSTTSQRCSPRHRSRESIRAGENSRG